jgi:hypothetical protein
MTQWSRIATSILPSALFALVSASASAENLTSVTTQSPSKVVVQEQSFSDGRVTGSLKNVSDETVNEVTLLIQHSWHWKDEYHPGPVSDNPGRSEYHTISEPIQPGQALVFNYTPRVPLPNRDDGHFTTTASVHEYTATGKYPDPLVH